MVHPDDPVDKPTVVAGEAMAELVYGAGDSADPVAHIDPDREPVTDP